VVTDPRRALPSVERLAHDVAARHPAIPRILVVGAARDAIAAARATLDEGGTIDAAAVLADATRCVEQLRDAPLRPLVNATGVILHTNLGRAPLAAATFADVAVNARGYSNLEYDIPSGARGSRNAHAAALLAELCGAEAGLVVNNNAAAVLLALAALARDHDVVVSRGELVEIGGGFRVPEIMSESGCRLVEVGTTNRTRAADYAEAIGPATALVLKVHASNYRMIGFTETTPIAALTGLGPPVMVDAGSGLLDEEVPWLPERPVWLRDEPGIRQAIAAGASLVTFSGDKLLGGPQAGIAVGRADLIARLARHPLARATRAGKLTLAALQAVALTYLRGEGASLPLWRMATIPVEQLRVRAEAIASDVPGAKVLDTEATAGGGSLPGLGIPSVGVGLEPADPEATAARLREEGVVARLHDGVVVCDLRTVDPDDDGLLASVLRAV
jgi:L-seryl-tRNA(Ser) seleniumtransferase